MYEMEKTRINVILPEDEIAAGLAEEACRYCFCPWCGAEVEPYERKYLKSIFNSVVSR